MSESGSGSAGALAGWLVVEPIGASGESLGLRWADTGDDSPRCAELRRLGGGGEVAPEALVFSVDLGTLHELIKAVGECAAALERRVGTAGEIKSPRNERGALLGMEWAVGDGGAGVAPIVLGLSEYSPEGIARRVFWISGLDELMALSKVIRCAHVALFPQLGGAAAKPEDADVETKATARRKPVHRPAGRPQPRGARAARSSPPELESVRDSLESALGRRSLTGAAGAALERVVALAHDMNASAERISSYSRRSVESASRAVKLSEAAVDRYARETVAIGCELKALSAASPADEGKAIATLLQIVEGWRRDPPCKVRAPLGILASLAGILARRSELVAAPVDQSAANPKGACE